MNRKLFLGAVSAAFVAAPALAAPGDVNAQAFYRDARDVMGGGMAALLDPRAPAMAYQLKDASARVRAENAAAAARGKPLFCVPDSVRGKPVSPQTIIDKLASVPESQRRKSTLTQAWRTVMIRDYPCR